jgi:hypothetical protein
MSVFAFNKISRPRQVDNFMRITLILACLLSLAAAPATRPADELAVLRAEIAELRRENAALRAELAALKGGKPSTDVPGDFPSIAAVLRIIPADLQPAEDENAVAVAERDKWLAANVKGKAIILRVKVQGIGSADMVPGLPSKRGYSLASDVDERIGRNAAKGVVMAHLPDLAARDAMKVKGESTLTVSGKIAGFSVGPTGKGNYGVSVQFIEASIRPGK